MKMRKILSLALAVTVMALTAIPVNAGMITADTAPFDAKGIVQAYRYYEGDYYGDKDGNRLNGLIYADLSYPDEIGSRLRMVKFEDGQEKSTYTGFTKSAAGKRYYDCGERAYGWRRINGEWYHFDTYTGYMSTGRTKICGTNYLFGADGKWTGKLSKSGFAPKNFTLSFYSPNAKIGFNTGARKLFYGDTEVGTAEGNIKMSARDRQVLYCMLLESGIESLSGSAFDEQYIIKCMEKFSEYAYYTSEPAVEYKVTANINGQTMEFTYYTDAEQLAAIDDASFRSTMLFREYQRFYNELEKKYPYNGEYEIFGLE